MGRGKWHAALEETPHTCRNNGWVSEAKQGQGSGHGKCFLDTLFQYFRCHRPQRRAAFLNIHENFASETTRESSCELL